MNLGSVWIWLLAGLAILAIIVLTLYFSKRKTMKTDVLSNIIFPRDHAQHKSSEERYLISGIYTSNSDKYTFFLEAFREGKISSMKCWLSDGKKDYFDTVRAYKRKQKIATFECNSNCWLRYDELEENWNFRFQTKLFALSGSLNALAPYIANSYNGRIGEKSILYSNLRVKSLLTLKLDKIKTLEGICSIHHQWGNFSIYSERIYTNSSSILYTDSTGTTILVKETNASPLSSADFFSVSSHNVASINLSQDVLLHEKFQLDYRKNSAIFRSASSEILLKQIFPLPNIIE